MNKYYGELSDRQAEYLSHDPSQSQPHACMLCMLPLRDVNPLKQKVAELFTKCTKEDVSLNNFLARSRMLVLVCLLKYPYHLRSLKAAGKAKAAPAKGKSAAKPKPKPKSGDGKSSVPAASETGEGPKRKRRKTN